MNPERIARMVEHADTILARFSAGRQIPAYLATECAGHVKIMAAEFERLDSELAAARQACRAVFHYATMPGPDSDWGMVAEMLEPVVGDVSEG